jgi:hypothetical protein
MDYRNGNRGVESEDYPHMLWLESVVRLGTDYSWISNGLPYIRLNFEGAVLPPTFTSTADTLCNENLPYQSTVSVSDPQSLPLTLSATSNNPDMNLSFVDNGNGTIDITTIAPDAAGLIVGDAFRIRVLADNGTVVNEQYYWVDVTDPIGNEEIASNPVNIYPNPSTGILNIENAANATIKVYNIIGDEVTSIEKANSNTRIDLNRFAQGTYIVKVISNNNVVSKKINLIK